MTQTDKLKGETSLDYMKRLCAIADEHKNNIEAIMFDMKKDNVIGFCKKCGCNLYIDKKHNCE